MATNTRKIRGLRAAPRNSTSLQLALFEAFDPQNTHDIGFPKTHNRARPCEHWRLWLMMCKLRTILQKSLKSSAFYGVEREGHARIGMQNHEPLHLKGPRAVLRGSQLKTMYPAP